MGRIIDIVKTPIVKISSLNGVSVIIRIIGGLLTSKAIAAYLGAGGFAMVDNFRQFLISTEYFATLGMQNGVIKYTAENEKNKERLFKTLGTIFILLIVSSVVIGVTLLALSGKIDLWIFPEQNHQYQWIIKVLAFIMPCYAASFIFLAVINGLGKFKQVIWINIAGNIFGVLTSVVLMSKFGIHGALLGLLSSQLVLLIFSFYYIWLKFPRLPFLKLSYFDITIFKNLTSYSIMTAVSALLLPVVYLEIRNQLITDYSPRDAGYFAAINRLSSFYMMFATTMMTVYFLPKLSAATENQGIRQIINKYYKSILPLFTVGLGLLFLLRNFIVVVIFEKEFLPVTKLFIWQLVGDFFKVGSLILAYMFFARKLTKAYLIFELSSIAILYISSSILIKKFGAEGAVMAHAFTFFSYWIVLAVYFKKKLT